MAILRWASVLQVFAVLAVVLFTADARSPHSPPLRRLHHPSRSSLEILPRRHTSANRLRSINLPPHPASLLHSDTILLSLSLPSLLPIDAHLLLKPTEHLLHPDAKITYPDGKFERLRSQDWKLYTGDVIAPNWISRIKTEEEMGMRSSTGGVIGSARVMVHHADHEPIWEGTFTVDDVTYNVLTRKHYERVRTVHDVRIEELGDMVVFRDADMYHDTDVPQPHVHSCSHDHLGYNSNTSHPVWQNRHAEQFTVNGMFKRDDMGGSYSGSNNFINSIGNPAGCPSSQQIVYMGVAMDCNYINTYGSTDVARTQVLNVWNQVSALYKSTFNISLGISELVVQNMTCPTSTPSDATWNVDCNANLTLDERLSRFSQWRGQRSSDNIGLWHLMSACPTDREVGVAWLGTLCQTTSNQQNGTYVSGTGVSTASKTEWSLVAHEVGHGFGAIHDCASGCSLSGPCCPLTSSSCSAGGSYIMNPTTSSTETKFSPCTLGNICSNFGTRATDSTCVVTPGSRTTISLAQCGNGIVDSGEDCDPGFNSTSACCDPDTCKFRSGAVCDPENSPCCTSSCQLQSAGVVCRAARDATCDYAEQCTGNSAACPTDKTAADGTSCGSNGLACASGTCTSLDQQCSQSGSSMNLTTACGQRDDETCMVTCKDPSNAQVTSKFLADLRNQCVILQTPLVDGSPCGYGGHCYNSTCQAGSWQNRFAAMYRQNLQISIPVTIVVGIIVLLLLFALIRCIYRSCAGQRRAPKVRNTGPLPPPPMRANSHYAPVQNGTPPRIHRHSDSVRSGDPITGTGIIRDPSSSDYPNPNPNPNFNAYGANGNGYGNGYNYGGHLGQVDQGYPQVQRYSGGGGGGGGNGWVDERAYNGPNYGRHEAFGR